MRKLLLAFLIIFYFSPSATAQLEVVGSKEYGQLFDLTYDPAVPNKIYAATPGNHIVASVNNGRDWEVIYTHPKASVIIKNLRLLQGNKLSYTTYATNIAHNSNIYVLSIPSMELVKTYEVPIGQLATTSYISNYSILESNPSVIMAQQYYQEGIGFRAKVFYSSDGGDSWRQIYYNMDYNFISPNNVAIHPANPQKLYIARLGGNDPEDYGGLFISNDAGITWEEKLSGIDFNQIAFKPTDPNTILLGTGVGSLSHELFRSEDAGNTWNPIIADWATQMEGPAITIKYNPLDTDNIIVFGEKAIMTTTDGFVSKQVYQHPEGINNPEAEHNYYYGTNVSFNPFASNEIMISANFYPLHTTDGGATVTRVKQPYFASFNFAEIIGAGEQAQLYYGVNNGYVHQDLTSGIETPYFVRGLNSISNFNTTFFADAHVPGRTYSFFSSFMGSALNVSNDHGQTLISVPVSHQYIQAVTSEPGNPNIIWCAVAYEDTESFLYKIDITDPQNITQELVPLTNVALLTALYIDAASPQEIWIALGTHIYRSAPNDSSWEIRSTGLESLEITDKIFQITNDPLWPGFLAITTTKGIFTTHDQGANWVKLETFPGRDVNLLRYSNVTQGHVVAVTYDAEFAALRLRHSADSGLSWTELSEEALQYITSYSAAVKFGTDTADVYLGTTDLGLVKHTIRFSELGNSEFTNRNNFVSLYPNPSSDFIQLKLQNEVLEHAVIFSATGQKLYEGNQPKIDVSAFSKGIYLIKISTVSGKTASSKFIKN